jgi:hypothetical protein
LPGCSASDIGFLLVDCSDGTAATTAEGIAFDTAIDADVDAGDGVPGGDSA